MRLVFIIMSLTHFALCQSKINFNYEYNLDLWKPYSKYAQDYINQKQNVTSNTYSLDADYEIYEKNSSYFYLGLTYKHINHRIEDKIENWNYIQAYGNGNEMIYDTIYYTFKDPADLVATSNSLGVLLKYQRLVIQKSRMIGGVGLESKIFFLEFYKSWYQSYDKLPPGVGPNDSPQHKFFFSSMNLSLYYLHAWKLTDYLSLGGKISLGTNLYSDWDQFQRYIWLGAGIELGFGKVKKD